MGNSISTTPNNQTAQSWQANPPTASLSAQNIALQLEDTLSLQMCHTDWLNSLYEAIGQLSNNDSYPSAMVNDLIRISQHLVMNFNADASDALEQLRAAKHVVSLSGDNKAQVKEASHE